MGSARHSVRRDTRKNFPEKTTKKDDERKKKFDVVAKLFLARLF